MKIKILLVVLIISTLGVACTKVEDVNIKNFKDQIKDLNEEVIKYIDELEDKNRTIVELEDQIEKNRSRINSLKNEIETLNKKLLKGSSDEIEEDEKEVEKKELKETDIELDNESNRMILEDKLESKTEADTISIKDVKNIKNDLATVVFKEVEFGILDKEASIPIENIGFDNILEEKILSPQNGNLYSYHKKLSRDGIVIDMDSKEDKNYIISAIFIESNEFKLKSGLSVGSLRSELEKYIKDNEVEVKIYNDGVYESFAHKINTFTSVYFEIEKNIISSIKIEYIHQDYNN